MRPDRQAVASTRPQLVTRRCCSRVEQDERRVGDADDRGQRRAVRVVDHHGAGLGVEPLAQPRGVAWQGQRSRGARLHDAAAEEQLAAGRAPQPPRDDREPLDELAAADADPGECGATAGSGCAYTRGGAAAEYSAKHEGRPRRRPSRPAGSGEPEEHAAPGEPGELDGRELVVSARRWRLLIAITPSFWRAVEARVACATCGGDGAARSVR